MPQAKSFWQALISSTSPNFQIWREALMYAKIRDYSYTYYIKHYPDFLTLENVTQTFKIQLEFEKGRIIITFKVLLPLFKTVIKQEQNKFKQDLAKYLFEKKIASLDAEIIILIV